MYFIPVEESYLIARREIWKNDMEQEIARVSNMVSQCKSYILNASAVNWTVKEGLNPTRYENVLEVIRNYFDTENYQNSSLKPLKNLKRPDRLITEISIQLAIATVSFNGQRPEVATFLSHDDLLSRREHPTLKNHSIEIVNE